MWEINKKYIENNLNRKYIFKQKNQQVVDKGTVFYFMAVANANQLDT